MQPSGVNTKETSETTKIEEEIVIANNLNQQNEDIIEGSMVCNDTHDDVTCSQDAEIRRNNTLDFQWDRSTRSKFDIQHKTRKEGCVEVQHAREDPLL